MQRQGLAFATVVLVCMTACAKDATTTVQTRTSDASAGFVSAREGSDDNNGRIAIRDACDPSDLTWAPTGGCLLKKGDVTNAEFGAYLRSPLTIPANGALIGHPAWRMEPSYASIESGKKLRIVNAGGRTHTFTEVKSFGGGRVPPLNVGLTPAPECATAVNLPPGGSTEIPQIGDGLHNFECCIHPWMRATVRVTSEHGAM
jgi:plastocyanin